MITRNISTVAGTDRFTVHIHPNKDGWDSFKITLNLQEYLAACKVWNGNGRADELLPHLSKHEQIGITCGTPKEGTSWKRPSH